MKRRKKNSFNIRLRLLFYPFIILTFLLISSNSILQWIFRIYFNTQVTFLNFQNIIISGLTTYILFQFLLKSNLNILKLDKFKKYKDALPFIVIFLQMPPTLVAEEYINSEFGKLTTIKDITQIDTNNITKYYKIKSYFIDKGNYCKTDFCYMTGKKQNILEMESFYTIPLQISENDSKKINYNAWIGIHFYDSISQKLSKEDIKTVYDNFKSKSQKEFEQTSFDMFQYFERIDNDISEPFLFAIENSNKKISNKNILFYGIQSPFENRNGKMLKWFFILISIDIFVWFLLILNPQIDLKQLELLNKNKSQDNSKA